MRSHDFRDIVRAHGAKKIALKFGRTLLLASAAGVMLAGTSATAQTTLPPEQTGSEAETAPNDEIVVTARRREESLLSVPVAVNALSSADIERYNSNTIGQLTESVPTVIISSIGPNGGGTLSVRGIGTSANQAGFEQAVSLAVDNVQTSSARLARLGNFDLKQAKILKGPQALYFGKNSPAGVISLTSRDPSSSFEGSARAGSAPA